MEVMQRFYGRAMQDAKAPVVICFPQLHSWLLSVSTHFRLNYAKGEEEPPCSKSASLVTCPMVVELVLSTVQN